MKSAVKTYLRSLDWAVIVQVSALSIIGFFVVFSATARNADISLLWKRQLFWFALSLGAMWLFSRIDYRFWIEAAYFFYWAAIFFLVVVFILGQSTNGAQRWLRIGIFSFQPSELAKLAILLALARYIGSKTVELFFLGRLFFILALLGLPLFLILKQPDLGSALLLVPVSVILMYVGGTPVLWLLWVFILGGASCPIVWHFLKDYQKERLDVFLDPQADPLGAGYNIIQSIIAIGSGGVVGKGFMQGSQTQLSFIPEHSTDFIFSVIGEEWGFMGCLVVLGLYYFLLQKSFEIAQKARDREGSLLALGIASILAVQVVVNIGMTTGLLPVTGLTLPFISYGGSSLIFSYVEVGILLNISYANRRP